MSGPPVLTRLKPPTSVRFDLAGTPASKRGRAGPTTRASARSRSGSPAPASAATASAGAGGRSRSSSGERGPYAPRAPKYYTDLHIDEMTRAFDEQLGPRSHGAVVTREHATAALACYLAYDKDGRLSIPPSASSESSRVKAGAARSGLVLTTVRLIADELRAKGVIRVEEPKVRGPGVASAAELLAMEDEVKDFVRATLNGDQANYIARATIQVFLFDKTGVMTSLRRVTKLCQAWGMGTAKLQRPKTALTKLHQVRRRIFTYQLHKLYAAEHELACTDQTFVNQQYQFGRSICILDELPSRRHTRASSSTTWPRRSSPPRTAVRRPTPSRPLTTSRTPRATTATTTSAPGPPQIPLKWLGARGGARSRQRPRATHVSACSRRAFGACPGEIRFRAPPRTHLPAHARANHIPQRIGAPAGGKVKRRASG